MEPNGKVGDSPGHHRQHGRIILAAGQCQPERQRTVLNLDAGRADNEKERHAAFRE